MVTNREIIDQMLQILQLGDKSNIIYVFFYLTRNFYNLNIHQYNVAIKYLQYLCNIYYKFQ